MAKTALEKQMDKIQRETRHEAHKEALRLRASSIVNGQDIIQGLRFLDKTAEEVLQILLDKQQEHGERLTYSDEDFPNYLANSIELEIEKLVQYGMISITIKRLPLKSRKSGWPQFRSEVSIIVVISSWVMQ